MCIRDLFFYFFWKIIKEKDWSDPQPDSAIQPKARGLLHMVHEYFAHHIWSRLQGLSTSQPRSNRKYLEDYSTYLKEGPEACFDYLKYSKTPSQVLDTRRNRLRRARGLVRPGAAELLTGVEYSRVKDSAWNVLFLACSYSYRSRTSRCKRKLPDPIGVGLC